MKYVKNSFGEFAPPIYMRFYVYFFFIILLLIISYTLFFYNFISILFFIFFLILLSLLFIVRLAKLIARYKTYNLKKILKYRKLEKDIIKSLIATFNVNKKIQTKYIEVPKVKVEQTLHNNFNVILERLAGMNDIESLTNDINVSFKGKYKDYAVTSAISDENGVLYKFILEDVNINKSFIVNSIDDINSESYTINLQKDISIDISKTPHIAIFGKSGSGKTTQLFYIILQLFKSSVFYKEETKVYFIDGKLEFSSFKVFYDKSKIWEDTEEILNGMDFIVKKVVERQKIVADKVKEYKKIGLTAKDIGLQPIYIICDELTSVLNSMQKKERDELTKYIGIVSQKGRSVGVFLILANQFASVNDLPNSIRSQFSTKILLGTSNSELQRMVFGDTEYIKKGDVESFTGYFITEKLKQPQKFFIADLHTHSMNELNTFEEVLKKKED